MNAKKPAFQNQNKNLKRIQNLIFLAENNLKLAHSELTEILAKEVNLKNHRQDFLISDDENVIEGLFDGENMITENNKTFPVPANYASKSKLVEGDKLKLTIAKDGGFIFKQIGPIDRKKIVGDLIKNGEQYFVIVENKKYKVISASITYFKGNAGDEVTIVIPKDKLTTWAAVEAIIPKI